MMAWWVLVVLSVVYLLGSEAVPVTSLGSLEQVHPSTHYKEELSRLHSMALPQLVEVALRHSDGEGLLDRIIEGWEARSGLPVYTPALLREAKVNPDSFMKMFQISNKEIREGVDQSNAEHQRGLLPNTEDDINFLPSKFDLELVWDSQSDLTIPTKTFKEQQVAPGVFEGKVPSHVSVSKQRVNTILAEVFNRLARNHMTSAVTSNTAEVFEVTWKGHVMTSVHSLLELLVSTGHDITATIWQRAVSSCDMRVHANSTVFDVCCPVFLKTGVRVKDEEILVPGTKPSMHIAITSSRSSVNSNSLQLNCEIEFGRDDGGPFVFLPMNIKREPKWVGGSIVDVYTSRRAARAIEVAAAVSDVMGDVASEHGYWNGGFGPMDVRGEALALVQLALSNKTTLYPLLALPPTLIDEVTRREGSCSNTTVRSHNSTADAAEECVWMHVARAVDNIPDDLDGNVSLEERLLKSIPWREGREPLVEAASARKLLNGVIDDMARGASTNKGATTVERSASYSITNPTPTPTPTPPNPKNATTATSTGRRTPPAAGSLTPKLAKSK